MTSFGIIFDGHPSLTRIEMLTTTARTSATQGLSTRRRRWSTRREDSPRRRAEVLRADERGYQHPARMASRRKPSSPSSARTEQIVKAAPGAANPVSTSSSTWDPSIPSTRRAVDLEIEGETITDARCGISIYWDPEEPFQYGTGQGVTFGPDRLPGAVFQRNRLPGCGEAARDHRRNSRTRQRHPDHVDGVKPDLLASGRARSRPGSMELGAMTAMFLGRERELILSRIRRSPACG